MEDTEEGRDFGRKEQGRGSSKAQEGFVYSKVWGVSVQRELFLQHGKLRYRESPKDRRQSPPPPSPFDPTVRECLPSGSITGP